MAAWLMWTVGVGAAAVGLALAVWAVLWDRPRGRRRCPRCWYDLASAPVPATCPECGRVTRRERALRRTRRRWRLAAAGAMVAIAAGWVAPVSTTLGWPAAIPAIVLRPVIATFFEQRAVESYKAANARGRAPASAWEQHLVAWAASRSPPHEPGPDEPMPNVRLLLLQHAMMRTLADTPAMRLAGPKWQAAMDSDLAVERLRRQDISPRWRQ